jgi:hypothetical protein
MNKVWKYQCGKCKKVYESPIALTGCSHRCSPKSSKVEEMKLMKEEDSGSGEIQN